MNIVDVLHLFVMQSIRFKEWELVISGCERIHLGVQCADGGSILGKVQSECSGFIQYCSIM